MVRLMSSLEDHRVLGGDRGVTLQGNPGVAGFRGFLGGRQSQTLARVDVHDDRMIGVLDLFKRLDQSEHVIAGLDIPVVQSERHEQVRPTLAAGSAQTGERAVHAAVILRDRHLVVVHDDDEVAALFGGVV